MNEEYDKLESKLNALLYNIDEDEYGDIFDEINNIIVDYINDVLTGFFLEWQYY